MAEVLTQDTSSHETESMTREERIDSIAAKFEAEDAKDESGTPADESDDAGDDAGDGGDEDDAGAGDDAADHDDSDDSEDTDEDTGDDHAESDEDSDDEDADTDDDADDAHGDESDPDDEDDATDADDDADDVSNDTKGALARHGADLTLEDVPEKYRPLLEKKLRSIDSAYTRAAQEATSFRKREREIRADEKYRADNPDLVVVDMLRRGGPELFQKVNKQLLRLDPAEEGNDADSIKDAASMLDERIEMRRSKAAEAVELQDREVAAINERAGQVEESAKSAAKKFNVPFGNTILKLLAAAITAKPDKERANGLSDDEIRAIVKEHADEHHRSVRSYRREESKRTVQDRSGRRKAPKPTVRAKGGTPASPGAKRPPKASVDHGSAESRQKAMLRSADRIMGGGKK